MQEILLHNLSAVINSEKLLLILYYCLIYSLYSNFINYFKIILYSYFLHSSGSNPEACIAINYQLSLLYFNIQQFQQPFFDLGIFEECKPGIL